MNKPIFADVYELADYYDFKPTSKADFLRLKKAWQIYVTNYRGDGCMGCVAEMLTATTGSKKETISNAGRFDCYIKFCTADGRIIPVPVERKTNGGRVETFETEFSKAEKMAGRYVVYSLDICNSGTNGMRRFVPAVVIPRKLFIEKLREFNAIKAMRHGGEIDGFGIQATSKKFYLWLADWPIVYDRNAVYTDDDFEGLE